MTMKTGDRMTCDGRKGIFLEYTRDYDRGGQEINMHTLNVKETSTTLGIKLKPFVFRGAFELHGITVKHTVWDDEFAEAPEHEHTESWDGRLRTRKLTAKGLPDQRTEDRSHYASGTDELACCHAFVRLLDAEKRAIFGDRFRDCWKHSVAETLEVG
jgi:hypothetical protein